MKNSIAFLSLALVLSSSAWAQGFPTRAVSYGMKSFVTDVSNNRVTDVSPDGRFAVFTSSSEDIHPWANLGARQILIRDSFAEITRNVSDGGIICGNQDSSSGRISDDGRYLVFETLATNLGFGPTPGPKIMLKDLATSNLTLVSNNASACDISGDGSYIVYRDDILDQLFRIDRRTGVKLQIGKNSLGAAATDVFTPRISEDGSYVAFASDQPLAVFDTNGVRDVYRVTVATQVTSVVSRGTAALNVGNDASTQPSISADGQKVAFASLATNIVAGDTNAVEDVFVRDMVALTNSRHSVRPNGNQVNDPSNNPDISPDGTAIVFSTDSPNVVGANQFAVWRNMATGTNQSMLVDEAGTQTAVALSRGGINASNIGGAVSHTMPLTSADTNGNLDVAFYLSNPGRCDSASIVTAFNNSAENPSLSLTGGRIAFESNSTNLHPLDFDGVSDIYLRTVGTDPLQLITLGPFGKGNGSSFSPLVSSTGTSVMFLSEADNLVVGDTNNVTDLFTWLGVSTRMLNSVGNQINGDIANFHAIPSQLLVTFDSVATNLVVGDTNGVADIFLWNVVTGNHNLISVSSTGGPANGASFNPFISANSRYVVFESLATNLVPNDTNGVRDIFIRDLTTGSTRRVSQDASGVGGNGASLNPSISNDGEYVAFESTANNLQGFMDNTNNEFIYVWSRSFGANLRMNPEGPGNSLCGDPMMSPDGKRVSFWDTVSTEDPNDTDSDRTVYVRTLTSSSARAINSNHMGEASQTNTPENLQSAFSGDGLVFASDAASTQLHTNQGINDSAVVMLNLPVKTVQGTVTLNDWTGGPRFVSFTVETSEGSESHTVLVNSATGNYEFETFLSGAATVSASGATWLRQNKNSATLGVGTVNFSLKNGDCNRDNVVDLSDYTIVAIAFNALPASPNWDVRADLNGDGVVDLTDYTIIAVNFNAIGD